MSSSRTGKTNRLGQFKNKAALWEREVEAGWEGDEGLSKLTVMS